MAARRPARVVVAGQEVTPPTTAELLAAFAAEAGRDAQGCIFILHPRTRVGGER
jgi:hypothetical protein